MPGRPPPALPRPFRSAAPEAGANGPDARGTMLPEICKMFDNISDTLAENAKLLLEAYPEPSTRRHQLTTVHRSCDHAGRLKRPRGRRPPLALSGNHWTGGWLASGSQGAGWEGVELQTALQREI